MSSRSHILAAGDSAIVIEFGRTIDPAVNRRVHDLAAVIETAKLDGVTELVPTYRSLLVHYDNLISGYDELSSALADLSGDTDERSVEAGRPEATLFEIPVAYGGEDGPDLQTVADHTGLTADEVVEIHSGGEYLVYMLGFLPGFPYLGGMDQRIACPRLRTPRVRVPAGSVGIAESQTGVYPMDSPGGWQLIGRTPAPLFDPSAEPPAPILPGSFVRFVPSTSQEIAEIRARVSDGSYTLPSRQRRP